MRDAFQRIQGVFAFLLLGILFAPFLAKPLHIDDANFVSMAQALELPLGIRPGVELHHLGKTIPSLNPLASTHPPLVPYLIRVVASLSGGYEGSILHTAFLFFPALLLGAVGDLARRVGAPSGPSMLAVGGSVALLPVGHNLMADLPTAALFAAGAAALARAVDRRSAILAALAAGLVLLSLAASYQTVFFLPALILLVPNELLTSTRVRRAGIAAALLLIGAGVGLGPFLLERLPDFAQGLRRDWLINRLTTVPALLGTSLVFLLPLAAWRKVPRWISAGVGTLGLAAGIALVRAEGWSPGSAILLLLSLHGGATAALLVAHLQGWNDRHPLERFLAVWAISALLVALLLLPFGALRYLIPVIIPATLLLLAQTERPRAAWLGAAATAALGVFVAIGDFQFAATYRDFAAEVRLEAGPEAASRVWYAGDWGMKQTMEAEGFRYLTSQTNEPGVGDLVIFADTARMWNPSTELGPRLELLEVREIRPRWPVLLMQKAERAGYYSTLWGPYPFVVSWAPIERFGIYRVAH